MAAGQRGIGKSRRLLASVGKSKLSKNFTFLPD
jgi:hypothetical protein